MAATEYYYKRIEDAISYFKGLTATFKQMLDEIGMESVFTNISKDAEDLDKQYESLWLNCLEDYKTIHKLEALDDSQKEEVALQNKDTLDILIKELCENSEEVQPLLMTMKAYKDIQIAFLKLYSECDSFMKQYVDASWDSEDESPTQLVLTPLELYYALTFLNEPTIRVIFAHVGPGVLEDILKAYHAKDKDAFCYLIKANEIHPSDQLLDYLNAEADEHSLSGIMSIFPSDPTERIRVLDAMNDNPMGEVFLEDLLYETSSSVEDITFSQISDAFGECVVRVVGEYCVNPMIPLRFRKKFTNLYNQARATFTSIPKISELPSCKSKNEIGMKIFENLEIDYIMKKIHEAMEADGGNRSCEAETQISEQHSVSSDKRGDDATKKIIRLSKSTILQSECHSTKPEHSSKMYREAAKILFDFLTSNHDTGVSLRRNNIEYDFTGCIDCSMEDFLYVLGADIEYEPQTQPRINWIKDKRPNYEFKALIYALYWHANGKSLQDKRSGAPSKHPYLSLFTIDNVPIKKLSENPAMVNRCIDSWVDLLKQCSRKASVRFNRGEI